MNHHNQAVELSVAKDMYAHTDTHRHIRVYRRALCILRVYHLFSSSLFDKAFITHIYAVWPASLSGPPVKMAFE